MSQTSLPCKMRELAATSILSVLPPAEQSLLDRHLAAGCAGCESEIRAVAEIAVVLGTAVGAAPPQTLRAKLMQLTTDAPRLPGLLLRNQGILIERSAELDWRPIGPGIDIKLLHTDTDRRYNTLLMRMAPGSRYGAHVHGGVEEIFMLSGEAHLAGVVVRAGDYCRADTNSIHEEAVSETGCLMLIIASRDNRPVA
ncbi:MAG: cupin domain-containing protein [Acidobacteriota bacterium]